jgi:hypothetical protein
LLAPSHGGRCTAEIYAGSQANFDDDESFAVEADEIDFTGFAAQISRNDAKSLTLQVFRSARLSGRAGCERRGPRARAPLPPTTRAI